MCTIIPDRPPSAEAPRGLHAICEDARRGRCDHCCAMPGEPCAWRGPGLASHDYHVARFTWARAHDLISTLDVGAVLWTVAATPFTSLTVIYDPGGADEADDDEADDDEAEADEARRLREIRALLAAFDWEHDDHQYALERIEMIVAVDDGQEDEPEPEDDHTCSACGGQIAIFIGRAGWHHYRGEGTAASRSARTRAHGPAAASGPGPRT
jgi:hypothetical protein